MAVSGGALWEPMATLMIGGLGVSSILTLIDTLDGAAHKAYGAMPNSIFVIDTDGTVLYRTIWNNTGRIGDILSQISARVPVAPEELNAMPPLYFKAITVLLGGGLVATFDFV